MRMVGQKRLDNTMRTVARSERLWARIKKGLRVQSSIEATLEKFMRCAYLATRFVSLLAGAPCHEPNSVFHYAEQSNLSVWPCMGRPFVV